ncbi:hypothetical protein BDZ88DRAFT_440409 [Geranomyces variabilis]|nr:hypothetical protein BDZ88DRAFT_440409 [Geranomyces variabilis]KAJ3137746.1 hypothetical protein HDU90_001697 [Geranomyces variabilis]
MASSKIRIARKRACTHSLAAGFIVACFFALFMWFPGPHLSWDLVSEAHTVDHSSRPGSPFAYAAIEDDEGDANWYPHPALGALGVPLHNPYIVVATMLVQQADFLPEWIEFHLLQGVDRFVIYHDSRSDEPDNTRAIAEPYIQEGVVEWVEWPADWAKLEKAPHGPRTWFDKADLWTQWHFNDTLQNDCIFKRPDRTQHLQAGCQKAAFLDVAARYRNRARWVGAWDVDEFVFGSKDGGDADPAYDWEEHKLSKKMQALESYDEVWLNGDIFGTNGFFDDPVGAAPDVKFPLATEHYRYRFAQEDHVDFSTRPDIQVYAWARKSLADPSLVISNHIHAWELEIPESLHREKSKPTLHETEFHDIFMFHYQYRSLMGCHEKAIMNGNPGVDYNPVLQAYMDEKEDTGVAFMVPLVKEMIMQRFELGWWKDRVASVAQHPFADLSESAANPTVCLAFSYLDNANLARFRRSITSIVHHLRTYEPILTFEIVVVAYDSANRESFDEFPIDHIAFLPDTTTKASAMATLFAQCKATYAVSLVDGWETRVTWSGPSRQSVIKEIERVVTGRVIGDAVRLLEAKEDLLEVWVGDVPDVDIYSGNRSEWRETPWRAAAGTLDTMQEDMGHDIGYYRTQSKPVEGSARGIARLGGTVKHLGRRALVLQKPEDAQPAAISGHDVATNNDASRAIGNNNTTDVSHTLRKTLHRNEITPKHRRRDSRRGRQLPSKTPSSAASAKAFEVLIHEDDEEFSQRAAALGFSSAHFCLGRDPESVHDGCDLDVDVLDDGAATGIMWRMRKVLEDPLIPDGLVDRVL